MLMAEQVRPTMPPPTWRNTPQHGVYSTRETEPKGYKY